MIFRPPSGPMAFRIGDCVQFGDKVAEIVRVRCLGSEYGYVFQDDSEAAPFAVFGSGNYTTLRQTMTSETRTRMSGDLTEAAVRQIRRAYVLQAWMAMLP